MDYFEKVMFIAEISLKKQQFMTIYLVATNKLGGKFVLKKHGKMGIKAKMVLSIAIALIVSFVAVGFIILSSSIAALNAVSYKHAQADAEVLVSSLKDNLEKPISTATALAESFEGMVKFRTTNRNLVEEMLYGVFTDSEDIYKGIFTLWEPDVFDGLDARYVNTDGTDGTGRLMTWYYKADEGVCKLRMHDDDTTFDYQGFYEETKSSMTNGCSEPYYTQVNGIETRCVALTSPIIVNGEFMGLVGYEVTTESLQVTLMEGIAEKGISGQWISSNGTYVAAVDQDLIMQSGTFNEAYESAMKAGDMYEEKMDGVYRAYVPYTISNTGDPWSVSMSVPLTSTDASNVMVQGLIVFAISLVVVLATIWFIAGSIVKPIKKLVGHADSMANGNMDFAIDIQSKDETRQLADSFKNVQESIQKMVKDINGTAEDIVAGDLLNRAEVTGYAGDYGQIMVALNKIMDSISDLVKNIKESASNVASASQQISNGSQELAQGSTEQAAAIEEINATVAEVVDQTRANSENASKAREISEKIHKEAENGNEKMSELLMALEEINTASSNISNIIKTIEDIAFQTNILALNASVEAARAGVHGKGFAVVAEEVKNLATKSAAAAKETNNLINASIVKAKGGVSIGEDMRQSLTNMADGINDAVGAITKIAEDSKMQVETIEQLNTGIEQISQVVQSNTATAEESASSSEEMSAQAELLNDMVERYKVK